MPSEGRTLQSLWKLLHTTESLQIAQANCRCCLFGQEINKYPLQPQSLSDGFPFDLRCHQRGRSHADGAGLTGKPDLFDRPTRRLAHEYDNLVPARRVVTLSLESRWRKLAKISRSFR